MLNEVKKAFWASAADLFYDSAAAVLKIRTSHPQNRRASN